MVKEPAEGEPEIGMSGQTIELHADHPEVVGQLRAIAIHVVDVALSGGIRMSGGLAAIFHILEKQGLGMRQVEFVGIQNLKTKTIVARRMGKAEELGKFVLRLQAVGKKYDEAATRQSPG